MGVNKLKYHNWVPVNYNFLESFVVRSRLHRYSPDFQRRKCPVGYQAQKDPLGSRESSQWCQGRWEPGGPTYRKKHHSCNTVTSCYISTPVLIIDTSSVPDSDDFSRILHKIFIWSSIILYSAGVIPAGTSPSLRMLNRPKHRTLIM